MGISYASRVNAAHKMIKRWGGIGQFVRDGVDRNATMAIIDYRWQERQTIAQDNAVRIRVSGKDGVDPIPDPLQDMIRFKGNLYKITTPSTGPRPAGTIVYLDLDCLWVEAVS